MTRKDREDLLQLVRLRVKVAKSKAKRRSTELRANFEEQLATIHKADEEHWRDLTAQAEAGIAALDAELAARCRELGIPENFRPHLSVGWYARGENASAARRAELRKVAESRIAAVEQEAVETIEHAALDIQTRLLAGGLSTGAAQSFLSAMPAVEALMPPLRVDDIERAAPGALRLTPVERRALGAGEEAQP